MEQKCLVQVWVAGRLPRGDVPFTGSFCCSVAQSCLTLCDPVDCGTPGIPVLNQLLKLAQIHVHCVGDAIQPSCTLSSPSPPAFIGSFLMNRLFASKVLEFQLQH